MRSWGSSMYFNVYSMHFNVCSMYFNVYRITRVSIRIPASLEAIYIYI